MFLFSGADLPAHARPTVFAPGPLPFHADEANCRSHSRARRGAHVGRHRWSPRRARESPPHRVQRSRTGFPSASVRRRSKALR
jgi:hypothetical protein